MRSPTSIQEWLDTLAYPGKGDGPRSPSAILREGIACCMDGALAAFTLLHRNGYPSYLVDLRPTRDARGEPKDDDHVIVVYEQNGYLGAVAMSNTTTLRSRDPIYTTLRELVLTYYEFYCSPDGEKTLDSYSVLYDPIEEFGTEWMDADDYFAAIEERLDEIEHTKILPEGFVPPRLSQRIVEATMYGGNPDGWFGD